MTLSLLLSAALIFCARVIDVSMGTFRILLLVRGKRLQAACVGFFEIMLYMTVLSYVIGGGRQLNIVELLGYCGGYASGNFVGSCLEEKFLSSFVAIEAIMPVDDQTSQIIDTLRSEGYGVTVLSGQGKDAPRYILHIMCSHKDVDKASKILQGHSFITLSDVKGFSGGYLKPSHK